jgi:hypothetical protein
MLEAVTAVVARAVDGKGVLEGVEGDADGGVTCESLVSTIDGSREQLKSAPIAWQAICKPALSASTRTGPSSSKVQIGSAREPSA